MNRNDAVLYASIAFCRAYQNWMQRRHTEQAQAAANALAVARHRLWVAEWGGL